jgi:hypothetical protein
MGQILNDDDSKSAGIDFLKKALSKQHEKGYFLEKNGYDSSYQVVSLVQGFQLINKMDSGPVFDELSDALIKGSCWQASRILQSGEISTKGNSRVYKGGEEFLGQEKTLDSKSSYYSMVSAYLYTNDSRFLEYAIKIQKYYGS